MSHVTNIWINSLITLKLNIHNSEYKQSPYGLDTGLSFYLLLGQIGALDNELTIYYEQTKWRKKNDFTLYST